MKSTSNKHNNETTKQGFTIIEVLIVLTIGGLILVVILIAIPTLQRNNRNNQRKNDVVRFLAAISQNAAFQKGDVSNVSDDVLEAVDAVYYVGGEGREAGQVKVTGLSNYTAASHANPLSGEPVDDRIQILLSAECDGAIAVPASRRAYAAIYQLENASGFTPVCENF